MLPSALKRKVVTFAMTGCSFVDHQDSDVVTATFLCSCGKYVCTSCRVGHTRTSREHQCKTPGCVRKQNVPVFTCSCGRRVCADCTEKHMATDVNHKCQCSFHNTLSNTLCSRCTCGQLICDTCMPLHYIQSKLHKK